MSSTFTQAQRDLLNNVKQAVALVDKEMQRIREQRIAICLAGFELDWQLLCIGSMQSVNGANKLGSMINAHTDFQAALKEIQGVQSQALASSANNGGSEILAKVGINGGDAPSLRLEANTLARSSGAGRSALAGVDSTATSSSVVSPGAN